MLILFVPNDDTNDLGMKIATSDYPEVAIGQCFLNSQFNSLMIAASSHVPDAMMQL